MKIAQRLAVNGLANLRCLASAPPYSQVKIMGGLVAAKENPARYAQRLLFSEDCSNQRWGAFCSP